MQAHLHRPDLQGQNLRLRSCVRLPEPDPADDNGILQLHKGSRRDLHISLTTEGKRFVEEKIYPVMEMENSIFDELTEQESEEYLRLAQKITCLLREKMNHR